MLLRGQAGRSGYRLLSAAGVKIQTQEHAAFFLSIYMNIHVAQVSSVLS